MLKLLAGTLLVLLAACVTTARRESATAFATRHQAGYEELTTLLLDRGWLIQDQEYGFHNDPRGLVGDRYELERADSSGRATLFVFTAESGNGSVMIDVSEAVSDDRMFELFDSLRELFDAAPGWRDPGVVFCVDHDPRHIAGYQDEAEIEAVKQKLRAQSGCRQFGWNVPR